MATQQNWRWCNKCQVLAFSGSPSLGPCAAGGQHDHNGSGNYVLTHNEPAAAGQGNWRWCNKCQALSFAGSASPGACPAQGVHDHNGSGNYVLAFGGALGQDNWQWCNKCQCLSFAGSATQGNCPAGGNHDHSGSGNYGLVQKDGSASITILIPSFGAGKVTCNGATVLAQQSGFWQFWGSLHDSSTYYGDDYALGFVFNNLGHGATYADSLGAKYSGGPVNGTFNLSGTDPWIKDNWQLVAASGLHCSLHVSGSFSGLVDSLVVDLIQAAPAFIALIQGS